MARGPLDDAIAVLQTIKEMHPQLNGPPFMFGEIHLTFCDGVVVSFGPNPKLIRGKDFQVSIIDTCKT